MFLGTCDKGFPETVNNTKLSNLFVSCSAPTHIEDSISLKRSAGLPVWQRYIDKLKIMRFFCAMFYGVPRLYFKDNHVFSISSSLNLMTEYPLRAF